MQCKRNPSGTLDACLPCEVLTLLQSVLRVKYPSHSTPGLQRATTTTFQSPHTTSTAPKTNQNNGRSRKFSSPSLRWRGAIVERTSPQFSMLCSSGTEFVKRYVCHSHYVRLLTTCSLDGSPPIMHPTMTRRSEN